MKKTIIATILSLSIVGLLAVASPAFAQGSAPCGGPNDILGVGCGAATGLGNTDIRVTIASIIQVLLGLVGTVVVVIIIWAGFKWMTANGDSGKVDEARTQITQAVIGLAIILSAYAITTFVTTSLLNATTQQI